MASLTRRPSARNLAMKPEEPTTYETRNRSSLLQSPKVWGLFVFLALCGMVGYQASGRSRIASHVPPTESYAVARLSGNSNVTGTIYFTQTSPTGPVYIRGELRNLDPNAERGFHIHELGDLTDGCMSTGSHYNPFGASHGGPKDLKRHVGDLGNIRSDAGGVAKIDFSDNVISLVGPLSIVGRAVLVHTGTDDLGRGGNEDSLKTGNAGGRAACGVIGYTKKP